MKKTGRKILALLLSVLTVLLLCAPMAAAGEKHCTCNTLPVVYVIGRTTIYDNAAAPDHRIPVKDTDSITAAVKEALPYVAKAIFLNQWDAYCDKAMELIEPFFEGFAPDADGNITNAYLGQIFGLQNI